MYEKIEKIKLSFENFFLILYEARIVNLTSSFETFFSFCRNCFSRIVL